MDTVLKLRAGKQRGKTCSVLLCDGFLSYFWWCHSESFSFSPLVWTEIPGAEVQIRGGGPAGGFLHPVRLVAGLQLRSRPPLEPTGHWAVQHGLRLKNISAAAAAAAADRVSPVLFVIQKKKNRLMMRVYVWVCACIWACVCLPACFESASILYSFCWLFWLSTTSSYPSHRRFLHSDTVTVHPQTNSSHRNCCGFVYGQTCSENLLEAASAALTAHRLTSLSYCAAAMNNPHIVFSFFIKERSKQLGQKNTFKYKSYSNHDAANISWIINVVIISKITSKCNSEINLK